MRYRITRGTAVVGHGVGGPATDAFLGDLTGTAQAALGALLVTIGLLLLFSTTEAGKVTGQGVMFAARKGARLIPLVGEVA